MSDPAPKPPLSPDVEEQDDTLPAPIREASAAMERDRIIDKRQKWALFWASMAMLVASGVFALMAASWLAESRAEADTERGAKQEIAQELRTVVCAKDDVEIYDASRCSELTAQATAEVRGRDGSAGPPGRDGKAGRDGRDGKDSTVPGPAGPPGKDGSDGLDSMIAGPPGSTGAAGKDSTVPGPAGPPGADGADGAPGADGRGISSVTCEGTGDASYWVVTYSDGTSQTSTGPCRLLPLTLPTGAPE